MTWAGLMGRFIRVCRQDWAGLTRAQLAIAVTHLCRGKERVTPAIVEAWEKGQPPRTSEELVALTTVLSRHCLGSREATDFWRAVYRACAERQYPELLEGEDVAYRKDVDALLEKAYEEASAYTQQTNLVWLVGAAQELEAVVIRPEGRRPALAHQRRQEAALVFARAALAEHHGRREGRTAWWAANLLETNADFAEVRLGAAGLGGRLSVLGQRVVAAFHRGHGLRSERDVERLFGLSEAAGARGERAVAANAYLKGLHCLAELRPGLATTRISSAEPLIEAAAADRRREAWAPHLDPVWACLAEGRTEEAERYLAQFEQWWGPAPVIHCQWWEAKAQIALQRGDDPDAVKWAGHSSMRWRR